MTCKNLPDCDFIDKIGGAMPKTSKKLKQNCCVDENQCVKNRLANTLIEHIEDNRMPDNE